MNSNTWAHGPQATTGSAVASAAPAAASPIATGILAGAATIAIAAALALATPTIDAQPLLPTINVPTPGSSNSGPTAKALPLAAPAAAGNPYVYSDVAERAVKSVVSITTSKLSRHSAARGRSAHPFFSPFGMGPGYGQAPQQRQHRQQGAGSGVIVGADGVVLTNNHVIAGADKIQVQLADRTTFEAKVIGTDPKTDLAVIKLIGKHGKLPVLPLANSEKVRLGEIVLAIGNSFGRLHHTVTMGIVSAKGRGNVGIVDYEDFIQTDAAINPGNSGGALVNLRGELLGINTAIASRSGGSQGVGFAIPSNMASSVMSSILDNGRVDRGWLGVVIQDMDDELMRAFKSSERGVLIGDVAKGSPAAQAGLRRGDVVVAVNGDRVTRTARLRNQIALAGAGAEVALQIQRKGEAKTVTVKLSSAPGQQTSQRQQVPEAHERIGMTLQPVDAAAMRRYRLSADTAHGALVTDVQPNSIAAAAGLRDGDVILEVGRAPFRDAEDALKRLRSAQGAVLLTVRRGAHNRYVLLRVS